MAAHILRLRIALLVGALHGGAAHVARVVLGLLVLAGATIAGCWALLTLRDAETDVAFTVTVLAGSAVTLGFAVAPLLTGAADPLDPRRFSVLGLRPAALAAVLPLAGLVSIPILALAALAVCLVLVWSAHGVPWGIGAPAVLLGVVVCSLLARCCMALTALVLRERRSRELTGVFVVAMLIVVVPVGVFIASLDWGGTVPSQLEEAVSVLALTPFGAAWATPARAAEGGDGAWLSLAAAVGSVIVLGGVWALLVRRLLTTTERPARVRERTGLGWFAVAPGTPGGAIAARSLVYWFRDRRYTVNLLVVPVAAALTLAPLLIAGVPLEYAVLVPVPIAAVFFGWLPHNDLAYDGTALWMHVSGGIRGVSDRVARLVPVLLVALPVLAIAIPLTISVQGRWALLPALVGVCASLFLSALGLSSISSVVAPYEVARPGESPFQQPQRTGAGGAVAQGLVMLGAIVLSAPALWWGWLALTRDVGYGRPALWGGIAVGVVVLLVGVVIGSAFFERRGGRLMEFVESA